MTNRNDELVLVKVEASEMKWYRSIVMTGVAITCPRYMKYFERKQQLLVNILITVINTHVLVFDIGLVDPP